MKLSKGEKVKDERDALLASPDVQLTAALRVADKYRAERDASIARKRLSEIASKPTRIISGSVLKERLANLGE